MSTEAQRCWRKLSMNAWRITWKDLRVLWRDRRSFVILVALPLVFITIIGLSTGQLLGWRNTNSELRIAVVNRDGGPLSQSIVVNLQEHFCRELFAAQSMMNADHGQLDQIGRRPLDDGVDRCAFR